MGALVSVAAKAGYTSVSCCGPPCGGDSGHRETGQGYDQQAYLIETKGNSDCVQHYLSSWVQPYLMLVINECVATFMKLLRAGFIPFKKES